MKINLLILNYEYPPIGGGAGIVTKHLAEEFSRSGHSVTILTTWFAGEPEFFKENNLSIIRLKSKRRYSYQSSPAEMYSWLTMALDYGKMHFDSQQFDLCLANFTLPGGYVAMRFKQMFNLPYVILSHGHDIPWAYPKVMRWWHLACYFIIKKICRESENVVVLSDSIKKIADDFIGEKNASKNIVIKNGLDISNFQQPKPGNIMKIVFTGRLVKQKAPLDFLQALKFLQTDNLSYDVHILGDGELKESMEKFVQQHQINHIKFYGKVSHSEVLAHLANAHLFVSSSESEGMSVAILEAISSGVYVICTNVSGNKNMIYEGINGNIIEKNDPVLMASKIKDYYESKFLTHYHYPAEYIDNIDKTLSWTYIAQQYEQVIKTILSVK